MWICLWLFSGYEESGFRPAKQKDTIFLHQHCSIICRDCCPLLSLPFLMGVKPKCGDFIDAKSWQLLIIILFFLSYAEHHVIFLSLVIKKPLSSFMDKAQCIMVVSVGYSPIPDIWVPAQLSDLSSVRWWSYRNSLNKSKVLNVTSKTCSFIFYLLLQIQTLYSSESGTCPTSHNHWMCRVRYKTTKMTERGKLWIRGKNSMQNQNIRKSSRVISVFFLNIAKFGSNRG